MEMVSNSNPLMAGIRSWLEDHPLSEDQSPDLHDVPSSLFDLTDADDRLKQLNRQIRGLPPQQQKLLLYLSRDVAPALIIESMEYPSPELFWLDKALLVKEVDPTVRQQDVLQVMAMNEFLVNEIISESDRMDLEKEKSTKRRYRNWSLIAVPVILLLIYLFVYPVLFRTDPVELYYQYKGTYRPDLTAIDTTSYAGGTYYEALLLMDEGKFTESATLFEEMILRDSAFRVSSRWFLALINLRKGDEQSSKEQLKALQSDDPVFFNKVAVKLYREII